MPEKNLKLSQIQLIIVVLVSLAILLSVLISNRRERLSEAAFQSQLREDILRSLEKQGSNGAVDEQAFLALLNRALGSINEDLDQYQRETEVRFQQLSRQLLDRINELAALLKSPVDPDIALAKEYASFGQRSEDLGEYGEATAYYQQSLAYRKSHDVMVAHAQSQYKAEPDVRNDHEIIETLKAVLREDPYREDALRLLGAVYLEAGDLESALDPYSKLAEIQSNDFNVHRDSGSILMSLGRYDEALSFFSQALSLNDADPSIASNMGAVLAHLGRHDEAIDMYQLSLSRKENYIPALLGVAKSYLKIGDGESALQYAQIYTEKRRRNFDGYIVLGDAYYLAKQPGHADQSWREALSVLELNTPDDVVHLIEASNRLASLSMELRDYKKALNYSAEGLKFAEDLNLLEIAVDASMRLGDEDSHLSYAERRDRAKEKLNTSEIETQ